MAEEWSDDEKLRRLLEGLQGAFIKMLLDQLKKTFRRPEESLHVCIENYTRVILRARQLPST